MLSVHNDGARSIDNGQVSLLVLLDLSAAFDTVDHQILLSILPERFAVADAALSWFSSYLADRTQQFTYAGSCTPSFTVDCSVPQGSVLGPLEFVVYTRPVHVGSASVHPVATVRNLGVYLDADATMRAHVTSTIRCTKLHQINSGGHSLTRPALITLLRALVISKLYYCNSVSAGAPAVLLNHFQSVLNAAARLVRSAN